MTREPPDIAPDPHTPGSAEAPVRGMRVLKAIEAMLTRADAWIERYVPATHNPLTQAGAIANTMLLVATVTGVLLLLWYVPSVQRAYASVAAMEAQPLGGGLVRALHRYSSDACVFFVVVHGLRIFMERRFTGARWLAWVTGILATLLLWSVGWTGYWLVWDQAGQLTATESARFLDALPIFIEPLARSFLTDASINSLLFLLVFFFHMLVPIALGVVLGLHISRVSRSRFLTTPPMTLWCTASLLVLSIAWPAGLHEAAAMGSVPRELVVDAWYLLPLWISGHLSTGALWSLTLGGLIAFVGVPWWMRAGRQRPSAVDEARCNACQQCITDCPYSAISLVPRTDGRAHLGRALVDPALCVGCGICAGSCDSSAIAIPWIEQQRLRLKVDGWAKEAARGEGPDRLLYACAEAAGGTFEVGGSGFTALAPGYRVIQVPCAGWVHALSVERALRKGFRHVTIAACPPEACRYREGTQWTQERMGGQREPGLRLDRVPADAVQILTHGRGRSAALIRDLHHRGDPSAPRTRHRWKALAAGALLATTSALIVGVASHVPLSVPGVPQGAALVVSFKHAASIAETCRQRSDEELESLPYHMRRRDVCERRRPPVSLMLEANGVVLDRRTIHPTGLWGDGFSLALLRFELEAGEHTVRVRLTEGEADSPWRWEDQRTLRLEAGTRTVVLFEAETGFTWHIPSQGDP